MIDHTGIGFADVARSAAFYDIALGTLGLRRVIQTPRNDGRMPSAMVPTIRFSGLIAFTRMV